MATIGTVVMASEEKLLQLLRKKDQRQKQSVDVKRTPEADSVPLSEKTDSVSVRFSWERLDRFLGVIVLLLLVLVGFRYIKQKDQTLSLEEVRSLSVDQSDVESFALKNPNDFGAFKGTFESRDVFLAPWEKKEEVSGPNVISEQVPELAGKYKILGIILDKNPQAIIGDIESNQTIFVSVGDKLGGATVESIQETKIIFSYNDMKVELTQ